ncbi:MAG: biotin/lipoate--protein ligase family protein [Pseudomonadota bacterium]
MPDPTFPPLLTGHDVKGKPGAFETAGAAAHAGEAGAGDVFWARDTAHFDWACVLEPEVETARALQMHFAAMVALGDAFGAIAPPEVAFQYRWPGELLVNGGRAGRARIAVGPEDSDGVPAWLVTGLDLAIRRDGPQFEPGADPDNTALHEEGCGEITRTDLVESVSRHFLTWVHTWNEEGFRSVHENWLARAEGWQEDIHLDWEGESHAGRFLTIDDEGNMILKGEAGVTSLAISGVLEEAGA